MTVWFLFLQVVKELIDFLGEPVKSIIEGDGELGDSVLQKIGVGFGSRGLCHGYLSMKAPKC